jgi:hypothetical protein
MIPKVLHRIWVGGTMPYQYRKFEEKWRALHPDWEIKTWGEADLTWLENQSLFDSAEKLVPKDAVGQFRSDVARYEILYRFGGLYADCDVEPQKCFDPLMGVEGFAGWEQRGAFVGNTVLGSLPGNSVMRAMIDIIPETVRANAGRAATWLTGPRVLTRVYNDNRPADFVVYPQGHFFPYSYTDLKKPDDPAFRKYPDAYSIHHWGHQRELKNRPLAGSSIGGLSVAIMAHPKREAWVPDLEKQLPGVSTVWDRKNDRWDTGTRALLSYDPKSDWHMVVQDDALLPPDFFEGVQKMLTYVPAYHPVGLYYGRVRPREQDIRSLVAKAHQTNAPFIVHNGPWWGVGIVLPTSQIEDVVRWGNDQSRIPNYDRRIARYYARENIPCYYPQPSLIQHRHGDENPSLVPGRNALNRRAWTFVGPQSALSVDWSGEPVRSKL